MEQGVFVAVAVLMVSLVITWALWNWWAESGNEDTVNERSLQYSFAQVVVSYIGLIFAGALGYFALKEYRESHTAADIRTWLQSGPNRDTIYFSYESEDVEYQIPIQFENRGKVPAQSYEIQIILDLLGVEYENSGYGNDMESLKLFVEDHVSIALGAKSNWRIGSSPTIDGSQGFSIVFASNGQHFIFLETRLLLCAIRLTNVEEYRKYGKFGYHMSTTILQANARPIDIGLKVQFVSKTEFEAHVRDTQEQAKVDDARVVARLLDWD